MKLEEPKKLKRGLKELSPLFRGREEAPAGKNIGSSAGVLTVSIFNPDFPADTAYLHAYLAAHLTAVYGRQTALVFFRSSYHGKNPGKLCRSAAFRHLASGESRAMPVAEHYMTWDQLDGMPRDLNFGSKRDAGDSSVLFLDFDGRYMAYFKRMIPLLDKWILHLQPKAESLTEAYKMLKAACVLNPRLECFLLFDGDSADPRGPLLFEKFSQMVARRLDVSLTWLGYFHLEESGNPENAPMALEHLCASPGEANESLEKIGLARWLRSRDAQGIEAAL
jgi:hypothetical protein